MGEKQRGAAEQCLSVPMCKTQHRTSQSARPWNLTPCDMLGTALVHSKHSDSAILTVTIIIFSSSSISREMFKNGKGFW